MKKLIKKFDNENGSALVLVMMVLVVVSALGGALGMVTINSHRLAENTQDTNSAYYIAEAGANMAYEEFKTHVLSAYETHGTKGDFDRKVEEAREDIDNTIYGESYFPSNDSDKIEAVIEIIKLEDEESTHVIRSTGKVDGKTRTVEKDIKVTWVDKGSGDSNPSDSFPIDLSNAISYNGTVNAGNNVKVSGHLLYTKDTTLIDDTENKGKGNRHNIGNNFSHIDGDVKVFDAENYSWSKQQAMIFDWVLPIVNQRISGLDFSKAKNNDVVYDNNAKPEGSIIHNSGSINFNNSPTVVGDIITKNGSINFGNSSDIIGDIIVYGGKIQFNNSAKITGNVISIDGEIMFNNGATIDGSVITLGNGANVKFGNGQTVIKGNVISSGGEIQVGNKVTIEGATINPSGKIVANNTVEFNGPVIINDITIGNNTEITYSETYKSYFPFNTDTGDGNAGGTPGDSEANPGDISDIISSTPATEN